MNELDIQKKQKAKDRRNNIIVILLSVILVALAVLFFLQKQEHTVILKEINAEKDSIQFELTEIVASYDSLNTENDTINQLLTVAQTKVKDLLIEVEQTKKVSIKEISAYRKQINTLRNVAKDLYAQVDSLNERNKILMAENLEVKEQYKRVEQEKVQLSQEKNELQQNLQRAAMLEARELIASPLNNRSKTTRYARKVQKIRVYFVLSKNVTTKRGSKDIYARITRPDQLLMTKSPDNLFQFEDVKIPYSAMRNVNYEGQELPVAIFWDNANESELKPGVYTIDLFADGNVIGETSFSVK